MTINNIKRALENEGIWFSCLTENDDINIVDVTTTPYLQSDMHQKLFILTTGNIKQAEKSVSDWNGFTNVILDTDCTKYLSRLNSLNLLLVGRNDIGKVIGVLNEALRR